MGFPIQKSVVLAVIGTLPQLFAANYVFRRLLYPRHPSIALKKTFRLPKILYINLVMITRTLDD